MIRTALSSGSAGGSEVVDLFGKERAQARLDYARVCAAFMAAELTEMREERYKLFARSLLNRGRQTYPMTNSPKNKT